MNIIRTSAFINTRWETNMIKQVILQSNSLSTGLNKNGDLNLVTIAITKAQDRRFFRWKRDQFVLRRMLLHFIELEMKSCCVPFLQVN